MKRIALSAAVALAWAAPSAQADDLAALRAEVAQMRQAYEQRIAALETRLAQAEARPAAPVPAAAEPAAARAAASANAFNPEISLILGGSLTRTGRDPETWKMQGFVPPGDPAEVGPSRRRGYSLGESELVMSANVDPNFRGYLNLAITPENSLAVEEAYFQTLGLAGGLTLKGGRFLSGIGYLNGQHPHAWDFVDAPLAYAAFFGNRLAAEGLQLKWLAPTETYLEFGVEAGRDDAFPGAGRNKGGSGLGALFARTGGDVGVSHSWGAGLSFVRTRPRDRSYADTDAAGVATANAFSGRSRTAVADFVWKWAPNGNPKETNFKFQAELFRRTEDGTLSCADGGTAASACTGGVGDSYRARQSGLYAQAVYQFMPRWRVGYRHDRLDSGSVGLGAALNPADLPQLAGWQPRRNTVMVDYASSEFARLRLQFARDTSRGPGLADNQVWLQYIMSLGAHGAHKF